MPHGWPLEDLSSDELELLIAATAAYQHHNRYKALHEKLLQRHQWEVRMKAQLAPVRQRTEAGLDHPHREQKAARTIASS